MVEGGGGGIAAKCFWRKVVVVGDHSVGKTSLIKRFCEDKFSDKYQPTIGADYGHKRCVINDKEVDVTFWDLAGGREFEETRKHLYADTQVCIVTCDANNLSPVTVKEWMKELSKYGVPLQNTSILVNKIDSWKRSESELTQLITSLSSTMKIQCFLVSALTGEKVFEAFNTVLMSSLK